MDDTQLATKAEALREAALAWLGIPADGTGPDVDAAATVAPAVASWVNSLPVAAGLNEWTPAIDQGAVLLAARLIRRRNSPAGIEGFNAGGATYTRREDPDVARLLQLDAFTKPRIG